MELKGYFRPQTIDEAKQLLSQYPNSKLLAGGTDLVLEMQRDKVSPEYLIDITNVKELKCIVEEEESFTIGAMVTFTDLKESKTVIKNYNSMFECAKNMGSPQIRNTATVGGNIANAGSAADIIPCIISLSGILVIESLNDKREISCEKYFQNYSSERIKENEILTKIIIPKVEGMTGYYKLGKRNSLAIARVSAAISLILEKEVIKSVSLSLGAVGRYPFKVLELEKHAIGKGTDYLYSEEALRIVENAVYESIKGRKTMPFKKEAVKGVYKEAVNSALTEG